MLNPRALGPSFLCLMNYLSNFSYHSFFSACCLTINIWSEVFILLSTTTVGRRHKNADVEESLEHCILDNLFLLNSQIYRYLYSSWSDPLWMLSQNLNWKVQSWNDKKSLYFVHFSMISDFFARLKSLAKNSKDLL